MFKRSIDVVRSKLKKVEKVPAARGLLDVSAPAKFGAPDGAWVATHRHHKGGEYRVTGEAVLEADRTDAVIYDDRDGTTWVRPKAEFYDGRFEKILHPQDTDVVHAKSNRAGHLPTRLDHIGSSRLNFSGEQDLRQLQQLSTPLWIFDVANHGIWWANPQGLAFWKAASLAEIQQRDFSSDSSMVRDRLRQILELASDDTHVTDTWTLYPSGSPETTVLTFQPVEIKGRLTGILIEVVKVLERNTDDDTWRLLEAARATSLMMTTFSMEGKLLTQNPASLACYGAVKKRNKLQSDLAARFQDPEIATQVLAKAAANETSQWEVEVLTSNGVRTHSLSVRKGRDPVNGAFVTVLSEEDVTEYVRLREMQELERQLLATEIEKSSDQLRRSQERFALAMQTAAILDWDVAEDELFLSSNFLCALGYRHDAFADLKPNQVIGRLVHPEDSAETFRRFEEHLATPGHTLSIEARMIARDGDSVWFHLQGNCVRDGFGKVTRFVGLLTDISERKQLEKKLMGSQRMEAIGQLTGGIAHDFNNLLTVIQGNAELLEAGQPDPELTGEIVSAARRGADLTRHLLAFARQQTLIPKTIDLNELVPKTIKSLLRTVSETVTVTFQCPEDIWTVYADRTQLETAILNLALNARDAMPAGGMLTISCENVQREDIPAYQEMELRYANYVAVSVSDTGDGMAEDTMRKAFEPFFTTKGVGQGSGLGLSMVLGFSRQSGGDARLTSQPGDGTTVTIYLPQSTLTDVAETVELHEDVLTGQREHIHILEDNQHVQQVVSKIVRSLDYDVTCSNTAAEAQAFVEHGPAADLYLIDILLPGGTNGVCFAKQLLEFYPHAKILFMSGFSDNHLIENSGLEQNAGFIAKPFDRGTISRALQSALHSTRPHLQ